MRRADAYSALASELTKWGSMPPADLMALVDAPPKRISVDSKGEEIELEISVTWATSERKAIRISGTANGPSAWRLERLEESIVVPLFMTGGLYS